MVVGMMIVLGGMSRAVLAPAGIEFSAARRANGGPSFSQ
jgi:hypothetical protein